MIVAERIKSMLTMRQALEYYGFQVNRAGFLSCPFHTEKTASLKVYERGFYCFGCGAGSSVIDFVMRYFGLDFQAAVKKLNFDFCLGLPLERKMTLRQAAELKQAEKRHQEELERRQAEEAKKRAYTEEWDEWMRLDFNRINYAPKSQSDEWHPLFVEALQKMAYQEYLMDTLP